MITEFDIIKKYLKPLAKNDKNSLKLNDDIYFNFKNGTAISLDTYIHGVHFINSSPEFFLKKVLRASLSDLFCKGIKPKHYFLSMSLNKKMLSSQWLKKVKRILETEQKKFNITLSGGDTTFSPKFSVTIVVLGYSKNKPVLRNTCKFNDDIYVTGNIGDSFIGLKVIKNNLKISSKLKKYFINQFYSPNLPFKIYKQMHKFANTSMDISDGLFSDMSKLINMQKLSFEIYINKIPISKNLEIYLKKYNKKKSQYLFNGDDYQILFTSSVKNRSLIKSISKKMNQKITIIGKINNNYKKNSIKLDNKPQNLTKFKGYSHKF